VNPNLTEILVILDRSGSMKPIAKSTIESFNQFVADQAKEPGDARLTLLLFNDCLATPCVSLPIAEVVPLNDQTYIPQGSTALLDAMGQGIDGLGQRLAAMPEAERPGTVIVATLTDGEENSSTRFTWADIQQRITHQTEAYCWNFLFLGANQDAIATASRIGIQAHNASGWVADAHGMEASREALSRKMRAMRKMQTPDQLTPVELGDIRLSFSAMVEEEDEKRRK
jgi:hypothetical protein